MEHETSGLLPLLGIPLTQASMMSWSLAIFVGTYIMIVLEKYIHRTIAALLGASVIMTLGILTPEQAWGSIDFNTIFLLFGMMNIVTILSHSGFFYVVARKAVLMTRGNPTRILWVFSLLTALFSAFLDNVTTVLFMVPVMLKVTRQLKLNPIPYVIALVMASNTGGTTTLIGDPPNIIIGSIAEKSFMDFLVQVAPYASVAFIAGLLVMQLLMQRSGHLKAQLTEAEFKATLEASPDEFLDSGLMVKALSIFGVTIVLFVLARPLGLEPGVIALLTSTILALMTRLSAAWIMEKVEWTTLIFFMGLFIVIGGLEHSGVFSIVASALQQWIGQDISSGILLLGFSSALISGFVDNIPFTISMAKVLQEMEGALGPSMDPLWWALSLGACLGGNLTLIGASANIVSADLADREGYKITFIGFMKYGTPVAAVTVTLALLLFWFTHR
ncbi:SLC13 family permease [Deinococcus cellulosilyticus]|uniref:Transporter n=1 Tax=Deinococcus cellulosilyticus (strain DSM 18568 / NBRC 106333 / KACC 11606 / 5516J-15) TaxID=1223518 RepID=A0A511MW88_DEIC1|nr:ArsB/NhaD family transporter [Deinococcus cellulosilyticus]GEM44842.1 transporter [Deinococcus cellulosilyticus NBRC 106333 = KACC 11606]